MVETKSDSPRVFVPPPLVFAALLALGLALDSDPLRLNAAAIAGILVAAAGLALIGSALGLFRRSGTRPEPWQPASNLVAGGIYRFTRNPMYLGMAMLSLGIAVAFASLPGALLALAALAIIDRTVVRREEAYLKRLFGQSYVDYTRRVRRWL